MNQNLISVNPALERILFSALLRLHLPSSNSVRLSLTLIRIVPLFKNVAVSKGEPTVQGLQRVCNDQGPQKRALL